jgi:hypothetical protein
VSETRTAAEIVTPTAEGALTVPGSAAERPGALLSAIVDLARDHRIDKEMLTLLMDRQERAEDRQAEREFNRAMSACQAEIQPVARTTENTQTRSMYAVLVDIDRAVRPIYIKHGFSVAYDEAPAADNTIEVICWVSHEAGHKRRYSMFAPPDTLGPKGSAVKTVLHGIGSTTTYLRNKLLCNAFNVVLRSMDDDGNRGGMKFVTPDQAKELADMAFKARADMGRFLDHFEADTLEELKADHYVPAKNLLQGQINALQRKQQGGTAP